MMRATKAIVLVVCVCQLALVHAQTFSRRYDFRQQQLTQVAFDIEEKVDGGYVVFISSQFTDSLFVWNTLGTMAIDEMGLMESEQAYPEYYYSTYPGWANGDARIPNGYIVGGSRYGPNDINYAKLTRMNDQLDTVWTRILSMGPSEWIGRQARQTLDGGFILAGETDSTGYVDAFLIKTDSLGNMEWTRTYGTPTGRDFGISVDLAPDGGYYVGGQQEVTAQQFDQWVFRVDANGDVIWDNLYGTLWDDAPNAHINALVDGSVLFASAWATGMGNDEHPCLVKIDMDGAVEWGHTYGASGGARTFFVAKEVDPGGDIIAAGGTSEPGYSNGMLLRTNSEGDSLWMRRYDYEDSLMSDGKGSFRDVIPTDDGGFIACGYAHSSFSGNNPPGYTQDVWVVKVDSLGCIVPGCDDFTVVITEQVTNLRDALQVFPNPARGSATVSVKLAASSHYASDLRLRLVSSHGQQLLESRASRGDNTMDVSGLAAGMYYVHLTSGNTWLSGTKLIIE